MATWRTETVREVDAKDRVTVKHRLVCTRCGAAYDLSRKTIRDRETHTCPERP